MVICVRTSSDAYKYRKGVSMGTAATATKAAVTSSVVSGVAHVPRPRLCATALPPSR